MASTPDTRTLESFPNLGANPKATRVQPIDPIQAAVDHFRCAQAIFDSPDADVLLECAPHHPEATSIEYTFKVHRHKLAAVSTFFADMIAISSGHSDAASHEADSLPKVPMEEDWQIVFALLGCVYHKADVMEATFSLSFQTYHLELYEAANKYHFGTVIFQTSRHLQ